MKQGQGSIEPTKDGRFRARAPGKKRETIGFFKTRDDAAAALDNDRALALERAKAIGGEGSFLKFAERVLDLREEDGIRGIEQERDRFRYHVASSDFARRPVAAITPAHVSDFFRSIKRRKKADGDKVSHSTACKVISLCSGVFDEAVERSIRSDNPCHAVRLRKKQADAQRTEEPWTFLSLEEQRAIWACSSIPEFARLMIAFAWGSGLRQGEQWNLELRDLHVSDDEPHPHVVVRFGSKGLAPKNGKTRRVPLFGDALVAARRWLEVLPTYTNSNPFRLVFPTVTGCRRPIGAPERNMANAEMARAGVAKRGKVELLPEWLALAGVTRGVRWHDLRHTCASSLVGGFWGRSWSLEEVKEMLGHSSIIVTQRYAHLGENTLKQAARETGYGSGTGVVRAGRDAQAGGVDRGTGGPPGPGGDPRGEGRPRDVHAQRGGYRGPPPSSAVRAASEHQEPVREDASAGSDRVQRGQDQTAHEPPVDSEAVIRGSQELSSLLALLASVGRPGLEPGTYGLKERRSVELLHALTSALGGVRAVSPNDEETDPLRASLEE